MPACSFSQAQCACRVVHDHRREADRELVVAAVVAALEESTRSLL